MKKLTHENLKTKNDTNSNHQKIAQEAAEKHDAKCCAKRSKNRVGCHD